MKKVYIIVDHAQYPIAVRDTEQEAADFIAKTAIARMNEATAVHEKFLAVIAIDDDRVQ